jgi:hypothetical protein
MDRSCDVALVGEVVAYLEHAGSVELNAGRNPRKMPVFVGTGAD